MQVHQARRAAFSLALVAALVAGPALVTAQSVNAGRGDLPVTVPSSYASDAAAPLIVLLHTMGRTGAAQDEYMGLSDLADAYGFIMVAPDGTPSEAEDPLRFWDASAACCNWEGAELDDSAYLMALVDAVKAEYRIDEKRIFMLGHSNGAFMAHRMAHDHSGAIAAIVSLAGADQSVERRSADELVVVGGRSAVVHQLDHVAGELCRPISIHGDEFHQCPLDCASLLMPQHWTLALRRSPARKSAAVSLICGSGSSFWADGPTGGPGCRDVPP